LSGQQPEPLQPAEALAKLRDSLAGWRQRKGAIPEQDELVTALCRSAKAAGWTSEQLVVAVKDACSSSPEISRVGTTSERESFLARIVTACIKEYYR
jgi:hypothetical protein